MYLCPDSLCYAVLKRFLLIFSDLIFASRVVPVVPGIPRMAAAPDGPNPPVLWLAECGLNHLLLLGSQLFKEVQVALLAQSPKVSRDPKAEEKFLFLAQELKRRGAAYIHAVRRSQPAGPVVSDEFLAQICKAFG
jgi:hypothetical protein